MSSPNSSMISKDTVIAVLNTIIDPCSVPSGVPAGLGEMGMVRDVAVEGGPGATQVRVVLCVTEPGCVRGGPFAQEAHDRLGTLPGVDEVVVDFDATVEWAPADMSPEYSARPREARERRIDRHRTLGRHVMLPISPFRAG